MQMGTAVGHTIPLKQSVPCECHEWPGCQSNLGAWQELTSLSWDSFSGCQLGEAVLEPAWKSQLWDPEHATVASEQQETISKAKQCC